MEARRSWSTGGEKGRKEQVRLTGPGWDPPVNVDIFITKAPKTQICGLGKKNFTVVGLQKKPVDLQMDNIQGEEIDR